MNPTKTGVELRCSGRGKKSLKIPKQLLSNEDFFSFVK
jgi:hypothetical protein